ncbi:MAG TPA: ABC transporter ATP-binding protein [Candidatus Eisenbacteria bacterium]|nr:ABC transporter ATP-binding protein [Candidatus Eisenbacteria bacterium]
MSPPIEIRGLVRRYGDIEAVRDLSLDIPAGEVFGLLGPNGAGKSTTLKVLGTLLRPTSGSVRLAGYDVVAEPDEVRRRIGYVPEAAELYDALTGFEFLDLLADLHALDPSVAAARRTPLLESFGLLADAERPIGDYSKGMRQKLLLTAALQHDPEILLLDEPLDGLDVAAQERLKEILRAHVASGRAVVYSSHILEVVERLCDRVAIIHRGRLVALGAPAELLAAHPGRTLPQVFLELTGAGG